MTQSLLIHDWANFFEAAANWCVVTLDDDRKIDALRGSLKWLTNRFRQSPIPDRSNESQAVEWFRWRAAMVIGQAIHWIADRRLARFRSGS